MLPSKFKSKNAIKPAEFNCASAFAGVKQVAVQFGCGPSLRLELNRANAQSGAKRVAEKFGCDQARGTFGADGAKTVEDSA